MTRIVAGYADNGFGPTSRRADFIVAVLLADMDAIRMKLRREIRAVVDDERDIRRVARRHQDLARAQDLGVGRAFEPELKARYIAARQGLFQHRPERHGIKRRRRYQIEPASVLAAGLLVGAHATLIRLRDSLRVVA